MSKLYVPLETLKSFLKSRRFTEEKNGGYVLSLSPTVIDELDALATTDPIATIDEMIEELVPNSSFGTGIINSSKIDIMQELKSRLYLNP